MEHVCEIFRGNIGQGRPSGRANAGTTLELSEGAPKAGYT